MTKKYLTRARIEKAKRYILESNYKINCIATRVGYDDPGYFTQVFKKNTGYTPRDYQQRFKNRSFTDET